MCMAGKHVGGQESCSMISHHNRLKQGLSGVRLVTSKSQWSSCLHTPHHWRYRSTESYTPFFFCECWAFELRFLRLQSLYFSVSFLTFFRFIACVFMFYLHECKCAMCMTDTHGGQKRVSESLVIYLWMVVTHYVGAKSSAQSTSTLNHWAIFQSHQEILLNEPSPRPWIICIILPLLWFFPLFLLSVQYLLFYHSASAHQNH